MGEGRRGGEQAQEGDAARIKKQDPKAEAWSSPDFQRNRDYIFHYGEANGHGPDITNIYFID